MWVRDNNGKEEGGKKEGQIDYNPDSLSRRERGGKFLWGIKKAILGAGSRDLRARKSY